MPITKKYFELGVNNEVVALMRLVHSFLSENKEMAYSESELEKELEKLHPKELGRLGVEIYTTFFAWPSGLLKHALLKLHLLDAVEIKEIRGEVYSRYLKELPEI